MERGICPIAAQTVTFRLPRTWEWAYGRILRRKSRSIRPKSRSKSLDSRGFRDVEEQVYRGHDLNLSRSCDVIDHVIICLPQCDIPIGDPLTPNRYLELFLR